MLHEVTCVKVDLLRTRLVHRKRPGRHDERAGITGRDRLGQSFSPDLPSTFRPSRSVEPSAGGPGRVVFAGSIGQMKEETDR